MSHIDLPEKASLFKVPEKATGGVFRNRWTVFWIFAVVTFAMMIIHAAWTASDAGKLAVTPGTGVSRQYTIGEAEWIRIQLPPQFWGNICTDKPVFVRVDGNNFLLDAPCRVFAIGSSEKLVQVPTMGDNTSGSLYMKAVPGQRMAQVTVTVVRKGSEEMKTPIVSPPAIPPAAMPTVPPPTMKPRAPSPLWSIPPRVDA